MQIFLASGCIGLQPEAHQLLSQPISSLSRPQASLMSSLASMRTVTLVKGPTSSAMMLNESVASRPKLWEVLPGLASLICRGRGRGSSSLSSSTAGSAAAACECAQAYASMGKR